MAEDLLIFSFINNEEHLEKIIGEMREHGVEIADVHYVHTEEEAREAIEGGSIGSAYMEWAHIPRLKDLRAWAKERNVKVYRTRYEDRRVRDCYRGAWGYKTIKARVGVELV